MLLSLGPDIAVLHQCTEECIYYLLTPCRHTAGFLYNRLRQRNGYFCASYFIFIVCCLLASFAMIIAERERESIRQKLTDCPSHLISLFFFPLYSSFTSFLFYPHLLHLDLQRHFISIKSIIIIIIIFYCYCYHYSINRDHTSVIPLSRSRSCPYSLHHSHRSDQSDFYAVKSLLCYLFSGRRRGNNVKSSNLFFIFSPKIAFR